MNELVSLVQRQFLYVRRQPDGLLLLTLPRLVAFIQSEPRLATITDDVVAEYERALSAYHETDRALSQRMVELWAHHKSWFMAAWDAEVAAAPNNPAWKAWRGPPPKLEEWLAQAGEEALNVFSESADPSAIGNILPTVQHWVACLRDRVTWRNEGEPREFHVAVRQIAEDHDGSHRAFLITHRTSAGVAWPRVLAFASSLVPARQEHLSGDDVWTELGKYASTLPERKISNAALGLGKQDHEQGDLTKYRAQALRDLDVLEEEILHRLGLHASRRALVHRFKTRCERFEAQRLRATIASQPRKKAEDILTLAMAEFLFDQGLNPLFNAEVVRLRPDLFDGAGPFALYVEAKQYVTSPRALLRKAARQMWDTWSELAGQHEVNEAFLVVFRRGGPLVTFDTAVRHGTRTLYPVLIDIAETTIRGSRAREQPVHISADDLLPKKSAHARAGSRSKHAKGSPMRKEYDLKNGRPNPYAKRFTPAGKQALIDRFLESERLAARPPSPKRIRTKC